MRRLAERHSTVALLRRRPARSRRGRAPISRAARVVFALLSAVGLTLCLAASQMQTAKTQDPGPLAAPTVTFLDITAQAGINFAHHNGATATATILNEAGPGLCTADYDGDGWLDVYLIGGEGHNALYRNNHDGTFSDVTEKAGVPGTAFGLGCVWGDYDNDGHPDLYVTQYGRNVLYHNNGDGTFTDVTAKAGVGALDFGARFHSAAAFIDYDRRGLLDLYAGSYVDYDPQRGPTQCKVAVGDRVITTSCRPQAYRGTAGILFRNNGNGTFANVTRQMGIYQPRGKNLAVQTVDYDGDGWPDLVVANDGEPAYLYHNLKGRRFEEIGMLAGIALDEDGGAMAAMNIDLADYDNDGFPDLFISDFQGSGAHLWRNDGKGAFSEETEASGIGIATINNLGFGGGFLDYDNDGWRDIFVANGHVYPEIDSTGQAHYRQINQLFHNDRNGHFSEATKQAGPGFQHAFVGRGVVFGDFFNNGKMDILVANNNDRPLLLRNDGVTGNHFVTFHLIGTKSNRDAVGARIYVHAGNLNEFDEVRSGGSYMSNRDPRPHFGLAGNTCVQRVEIVWPNGLRQAFSSVPADHFWVITEGEPHPRLDAGDPQKTIQPCGRP
jgi:hypothetical protein